MRIARIIVKNFQCHELFELELSPKLTAIIGVGDSGKSALLRAAGFLLTGDPNTDDLRRHWYEGEEKVVSKQTSVAMESDDGTVVERIRSASINRYVIKREGQPDLKLDRFGRGIPQDVLEATGMEPLTIGDQTLFPYIQRQHDPYFLLSGMTGPSRWKAISNLAGTEAADKAGQGLNSDIGELGKAINVLDKQIAEDSETLAAEQAVLESLESLFATIDALGVEVEELSGRHDTTNDLLTQWTDNEGQMDSTLWELGQWSKRSQSLREAFEGVGELGAQHKAVKKLVDDLGSTDDRLQALEPRLKAASKITEIEVPDTRRVTKLTNLIRLGQDLNAERSQYRSRVAAVQAVLGIEPPDLDRYHQLRAAVDAARTWTKDRSECVSSLSQAEERVREARSEFEAVLVEAGQCPLCGKDQSQATHFACS